MIDNRVVVRGLALLDELLQANTRIRFRTRKDEMTRFCGGFTAIRASCPAGEIHDEIPVNVNRELRAMMQTDIEVTVKFSSKSLSITLGECYHTTTHKQLSIKIRWLR